MKIKFQNIKFFLQVVIIFSLLINTNLSFGNNLIDENVDKVRAWEVIYGDGSVLYRTYRSNIDNLTKVDDYLSYNPNKIDELKEAFNTAPNKDEFIGSFIGGPLRKNELEELNNLYYRQASTYDDGAGGAITAAEADRIEVLESQLGSYEHPNMLTTSSTQAIANTSTTPQLSPDNFWADVKVADGKIEGLIPDKKYDYVITYPFDNSQPELRLGLGHYRISGGSNAVKGAGSLRFNSEGKIYEINRQSGHYQSVPESRLPTELDEIISILESNNLAAPNIIADYSL